MLKNIFSWVARCFQDHQVRGLELRPVQVNEGKVSLCPYGQQNGYGLYQRDSEGLHLRQHFESYTVAQRHAHACALQLNVMVFDHIEVEETQRALRQAM